jgi:hypothetical protein
MSCDRVWDASAAGLGNRLQRAGRGELAGVKFRARVCVKQSWMYQFLKVVPFDSTVAKDLVQQPRPDCLAGVDRHHSSPSAFVAEEVVASLDPYDNEARLCQRGYQIRTGQPQRSTHAAIVIRWMPMNSRLCLGVPSASRHNSIASRIRCVTSSRDRACV